MSVPRWSEMHLWFFVFTVLFKILLSLPKSNILYMMCMHILIYDNASFSDLIIETEKTLLIKLIMSASRVLNGGKMWDVHLRHENENFVAFQFSSTIFRKLLSIYFHKFFLNISFRHKTFRQIVHKGGNRKLKAKSVHGNFYTNQTSK